MEQFGAKKQANVENPDESKQQGEPCKQKKRGRKPTLTQEERRTNKIERNRKYRKAKKAKSEASEKKSEELEKKEAALLSEINSLKEKIENFEKEKEADLVEISSLKKELSEINDQADRADNLVREVGDKSKKVKMAGKALESEMLQLEKKFLDSDDQLNSFNSYLLEALDAVLYLIK